MYKRQAFEYACHYALAVMFEQIDAVQIAATPDGNLVGFDFTDCFRLSDLTEAILKKQDTLLIHFLKMLLNAFKQDDFSSSARLGAEEMCIRDRSTGSYRGQTAGTKYRLRCLYPKVRID